MNILLLFSSIEIFSHVAQPPKWIKLYTHNFLRNTAIFIFFPIDRPSSTCRYLYSLHLMNFLLNFSSLSSLIVIDRCPIGFLFILFFNFFIFE